MRTHKVCTRCKEDLQIANFYMHTSSSGYLFPSAKCKPCTVKATNEYQGVRPEKTKAWRAKYRLKMRGSVLERARIIRENMIQRSKRKGWPPPEFTIDEIVEHIRDGVCSRTGIPFDFSLSGVAGVRSPWCPTPDRIDSTKGYIKGNVQWVCLLYNSAKSNWRDDDVLAFARAVIKLHDGYCEEGAGNE